MKRFSLLRMGALAAAVACLAPHAMRADDYDKKTIVTLGQPTQAPGIVLQPGKYVIKLLNSPSNRHIAEIMNERMDHLYALTFTAAAQRPDRTDKNILTYYEGANGQPPALRKWFWPGEDTGQEFLYPKDQAARIAAASNEKVPEGPLPTVAESGQSLIPDNAKPLTLESREEPKQTATPFVAAAAEAPKPPEPVTVIAQNTPPPQRTQSDDISQSTPAAAVNSGSSSSDTTLPQTASYVPLIGAMGLASLALAIVLASVRRYRSS